LITVLLFLSIPAEQSLPALGQSLVIQVVLISSLMMMAGTVLGQGGSEPGLDHRLPIGDGEEAHAATSSREDAGMGS
jgi:hypothetical protein